MKYVFDVFYIGGGGKEGNAPPKMTFAPPSLS